MVKETVSITRRQLSDPVLVLAALPRGGLSLPSRPCECERDKYDPTPCVSHQSLIPYG
jgi:hypothetical protein